MDTLNQDVFSHILSFLSNQTKVKLQAITGKTYPGTSALASSVCCACESDRIVVACGKCIRCNIYSRHDDMSLLAVTNHSISELATIASQRKKVTRWWNNARHGYYKFLLLVSTDIPKYYDTKCLNGKRKIRNYEIVCNELTNYGIAVQPVSLTSGELMKVIVKESLRQDRLANQLNYMPFNVLTVEAGLNYCAELRGWSKIVDCLRKVMK